MCFNEDVLSCLCLSGREYSKELAGATPSVPAAPLVLHAHSSLDAAGRTAYVAFAFFSPFPHLSSLSLPLPASILPTCLPRLYHASSCRGNAADAGSSWEHVAK